MARALLAASGYKVRGVTRNPDSEKAKALKDAGAEVVKGNMDDAASIEAAVSGAYGAFLVTNYMGSFSFVSRIQRLRGMRK